MTQNLISPDVFASGKNEVLYHNNSDGAKQLTSKQLSSKNSWVLFDEKELNNYFHNIFTTALLTC